MKIFQKQCITFLLICLAISSLLFITSCYDENFMQQTNGNDVPFIITNDRDRAYIIGRRIRELSLIPGIDEPAILVNGDPITRREINTRNIRANYPNRNSQPFDEIINIMLRQTVALQEAQQRGLQPIPGRLHAGMETLRRLREDMPEIISAHIEGLGISEDEYFNMRKESEYNSVLIDALAESIIETHTDEIRVAADIRMEETDEALHRAFFIVSQEFVRDYFDNLVEQANIEILDPEIRELLQ